MSHDPAILATIGTQMGITPTEVEARITEYEVENDGGTFVQLDNPMTEEDFASGCQSSITSFIFDAQGKFKTAMATQSCWGNPLFTETDESFEFAPAESYVSMISEDGCITRSIADYWGVSSETSTDCPVSSGTSNDYPVSDETLWMPTGRGYHAVFSSDDPEAARIARDHVSQLERLDPENLSEMSYEDLRELHDEIYLTRQYVDFVDVEDKAELYAAVDRADAAVNAEIEQLIEWAVEWLPENDTETLNARDLEALRADHEDILSMIDDIQTLLGTEGHEDLLARLDMLDGNIEGRIMILEDAGASSTTSCDEL